MKEEPMNQKRTRSERRRRDREHRAALFRRHSTRVVKGQTLYTHKGGRLSVSTLGLSQAGHIWRGAGDSVYEPERVVFLSSAGACGLCPVSLVCHGSRSWLGLADRYVFFRCWRCQCFAFTPVRLHIAGTVHQIEARLVGPGGNGKGSGGGSGDRGQTTLFICTLLRTGRQPPAPGQGWSCDKGMRNEGKMRVNTIISGGDVFATREAAVLDSGDIPFGCATRCYDARGDIVVKKLPVGTDCRTTVGNARQGGGAERGVVRV